MALTLSKCSIEMGMTYGGEAVKVSGKAPAGSQLAMVLSSNKNPAQTLTRKGRVGLFWMGVKQLEACNMPFLYRVYTSGPVTQVAAPDVAYALSLGYPSLKSRLVAKCLTGEPSDDDSELLFKGFVQLKEGAGLYGVEEGKVQVGPDGSFEHAVYFPDKAPEGAYTVNVYALKDGHLVASGSGSVEAHKVGLSAWLTKTSKENGTAYGVLAVVVALSAGLGIGAIFKKGGAH
jgi:uncharacterized protein (TIGR02186 family)